MPQPIDRDWHAWEQEMDHQENLRRLQEADANGSEGLTYGTLALLEAIVLLLGSLSLLWQTAGGDPVPGDDACRAAAILVLAVVFIVAGIATLHRALRRRDAEWCRAVRQARRGRRP